MGDDEGTHMGDVRSLLAVRTPFNEPEWTAAATVTTLTPYGVQGPVELPVAAAVDPAPVGRPRGSRISETPANEAIAASDRNRPGCDQLTRTWAAVIGPMPSAEQIEELGGQLPYQAEQLVLKGLGLGLQFLDAVGRGPKGPCGHAAFDTVGGEATQLTPASGCSPTGTFRRCLNSHRARATTSGRFPARSPPHSRARPASSPRRCPNLRPPAPGPRTARHP